MHTKTVKSEKDFLKELESRASLQSKLVETEILPEWAKGIGEWLTLNPWRVIVPISAIIYLLLRMLLGTGYREAILSIFGGF